MPTIVVKMRNLKKLFGNDLLQLALLLSLMRVDPDAFLGLNPHYGSDSFGDVEGPMWAQTQTHEHFNFPERLHPKSLDSMLERWHDEILEDLNSLGRYSRIRSYYGTPVEISAYILNTEPGSSLPVGSDSDSGISDTEHTSSHSDSDDDDRNASPLTIEEGFASPLTIEDDKDFASPFDGNRTLPSTSTAFNDFVDVSDIVKDELEHEMELVGDPVDVLGGIDQPPPLEPDDLRDLFLPDHEDVQNQLLHIDDQLMSIDEQFLHLDEQLAVHMTEEEVRDETPGVDDEDLLLNTAIFDANPFDEWQRDTNTDFDELMDDLDVFAEDYKLDEAVGGSTEQTTSSNERPSVVGPKAPTAATVTRNGGATEFYDNLSDIVQSSSDSYARSDLLNLDSQEPTNGAAWNSQTKPEEAVIDELFRTPLSEAILRNVSLGPTSDHSNGSFPQGAVGGVTNPGGVAMPLMGNQTSSNGTQTANFQNGGFDSASFGSIPTQDADLVKEIINAIGSPSLNDVGEQIDKLLKAQQQQPVKSEPMDNFQHPYAFQQPNVDFQNTTNLDNAWPNRRGSSQMIYNQTQGTPDTMDLDEASSGRDFASTLNMTGMGYGFYGNMNRGYSAPYTPMMNHSYALPHSEGGASANITELQCAAGKKGPKTTEIGWEQAATSFGRRETCDETSSTTSSSADRPRQSRDERKASQLGIPFTVHEIIHLPMDEFTDLLSRHDLSEEQLNMCRDIRRRGKNKVAAQNCRKRKLLQIQELEIQVQHARHRKRELMEERETLYRQMNEWGSLLMDAEAEVLANFNKNVKEFALEIDANDELHVARRQAPIGAEVGLQTRQGESRFLGHNRRHWKKDNVRDLK